MKSTKQDRCGTRLCKSSSHTGDWRDEAMIQHSERAVRSDVEWGGRTNATGDTMRQTCISEKGIHNRCAAIVNIKLVANLDNSTATAELKGGARISRLRTSPQRFDLKLANTS